ncbi:hypothetical protein VTI28DRAFT_1389 [Corynascus sepedonium]
MQERICTSNQDVNAQGAAEVPLNTGSGSVGVTLGPEILSTFVLYIPSLIAVLGTGHGSCPVCQQTRRTALCRCVNVKRVPIRWRRVKQEAR